jgi:hypothetical protein
MLPTTHATTKTHSNCLLCATMPSLLVTEKPHHMAAPQLTQSAAMPRVGEFFFNAVTLFVLFFFFSFLCVFFSPVSFFKFWKFVSFMSEKRTFEAQNVKSTKHHEKPSLWKQNVNFWVNMSQKWKWMSWRSIPLCLHNLNPNFYHDTCVTEGYDIW